MEVISTIDGYSIIVDDEEVICYETDKHLVGEDIAKCLGLSKQSISKILRKAIEKLYIGIRGQNKNFGEFETVSLMAEMFGVKTQDEYRRFYKLFSNEIKSKVRRELSEQGYGNKTLY